MADPDPKKLRGIAKGRFTRICNSIYAAVEQNKTVEYVDMLSDDLKEAWIAVNNRHEAVVLHSVDAEEENDEWIVLLGKRYDEVREVILKHKTHINEQHMDSVVAERKQNEREVTQTSVMRAMGVRGIQHADFKQLCDQIGQLIIKNSVEAVKAARGDLAKLMEDVKAAHMNYVAMLPTEQAVSENDWFQSVRDMYGETSSGIGTFLEHHANSTAMKPTEEKKRSGIHLEKMRLPNFDGDIRSYPRFKADFTKFILPETTKDQAAFVLRKSLGGKPLQIVGAVDDDINEIWRRLDERYGDPIKLDDTLKDGEDQKFVELVDVIERGYNDLQKLGKEKEMSNTRVVGDIEKRLPPTIRREWSRSLYDEKTVIDRTNRFPALLQFLVREKKSVEYEASDVRNNIQNKPSSRITINAAEVKQSMDVPRQESNKNCLVHDMGQHNTSECRTYLAKSLAENAQLVREKGACFGCLLKGHRVAECRKKRQCGVSECTRLHHSTLHDGTLGNSNIVQPETTINNHTVATSKQTGICLLQLMKIKVGAGHMNVLFDGCATSSLITNKSARATGLKGNPVKIAITKVGGITEEVDSFRYLVPLVDKQGFVVNIFAYGIDQITSDIEYIAVHHVVGLFSNIKIDEIERPSGQVDLLIGYEYAGYHPIRLQAAEHLLVLENRFGRCLGGSHPTLKENTTKLVSTAALIHHVTTCNLDSFFKIEGMGVQCNPQCGSCRCGRCPVGAKEYTLKEERELVLIEKNLTFCGSHWIAEYPWIRDPTELPDNRHAALSALKSLEYRLRKDPAKAAAYDAQMRDMLERNVAREIGKRELDCYDGPVHYIAHHAVMKPDSSSTPMRIVFNSSATYQGHILNNYWAKGPDMVNALLGVLIRFRENAVALIADIRKMYHCISTTVMDQHCHRFLWRNMDDKQEPKTFCMTVVNMGDRPSATIATVALKKTAEQGKGELCKAADTILRNVYVDDILESVESREAALRLSQDIDKLIAPGNFTIKKWIISGSDGEITDKELAAKGTEKVLGVAWDSCEDVFKFTTRLEVPVILTKRTCLSRINGIYDPLGLISPFTVKGKILLRKIWGEKLEWDDTLPDAMREQWFRFFDELAEIASVSFPRCVKPDDAEPSAKPTLVVFSDGSEQAFGAVAYARYLLKDGRYACRLIASKNRVAPLEIISIVRLELSGAVLNKRLSCYIKKEMRIEFEREFHIVDSEIVRAMIQKQSYGFRTFGTTRIGEIQAATNPQDWWWCKGELNVADRITRGERLSELGVDSTWQLGPDFLRNPVEQLPVQQSCSENNLPERVKVVMVADAKEVDTLANRINIERYSSYTRLLQVTARVKNMYKRKMFSGAIDVPTAKDINDAELFWIIECQKPIMDTLINDKKHFDDRYAKLSPRVRGDGVIVVGARAQRHVNFSYNNQEVPLLPAHHRFSRLYATHAHNRSHCGVQSTVARVRLRYWILNLQRLAKSIRHHCVPCKKRERDMSGQQMGQLPIERLRPSPPWSYIGIDLFGPFMIRGEVNKRARGKAYGIVFSCFVTRAVYLDLATDYSTSGFIQIFRRFVSIRGYPVEIYSDGGSQLVSASKALKRVMDGWEKSDLREFGITSGTTWKFSAADSPWQNGVTEILIKGIKKAIYHAIGDQVLPYNELQTVLFEVANLVNERPIGRHPTDPEDGAYLCPNNMLLGRATTRVPSGPWRITNNPRHRVEFIQNIIKAFWIKWNRDYFPSLIIRQKWHHEKRNMRIGYVVLVQDSNVVRGKWRMGLVTDVCPDRNGKVRTVQVQLKSEERNGNQRITRAVQRLIVLVPIDNGDE